MNDCIKTSSSGIQSIASTGSDTPLRLKGSTGSTYLEFMNSSGTTLGYLAVLSTGKPAFFDSGNHEIALTENVLQRLPWWNYNDTHNADDLRSGIVFAYANHNTPYTGTLVSFSCSNEENYPFQLNASYGSQAIAFRTRNGDNSTWSSWARLISENCFSYSNGTLTITT